jgi:hypothetical protein
MARLLFVVSRDALHRYEDMRRAFEGEDSVEVILDRRQGERRREERAHPVERRRTDRRVHDSATPDDHGWTVTKHASAGDQSSEASPRA